MKTTDAVEIRRKRFYNGNPERLLALELEKSELDVAQQVFALRRESKLPQKALAELVGTSTSVISRLESADYTGHSLSMLRRIADALNKEIRITFVDKPSAISDEEFEVPGISLGTIIPWKQTALFDEHDKDVTYSEEVESWHAS